MAKKKEPSRKDAAKAVGASGVWVDGRPGQVWSDGKKDHRIVGIVTEGFDSVCDGVPENHRLRWHETKTEVKEIGGIEQDVVLDVEMALEDDEIAAVSAWKRKA